ncbi:MAG: hypothetical protein P9M13_11105 [Candidatus Ancaeobacter aquaticus]|nr:hypothetical protein [Candidatus Ancaeobacter aquaticus]
MLYIFTVLRFCFWVFVGMFGIAPRDVRRKGSYLYKDVTDDGGIYHWRRTINRDYRRYYRFIRQHGGVEGFLSAPWHPWFCYRIATETGLWEFDTRDSSYRLLQLRGKNIYPSKYSKFIKSFL